MPAAESPPHHPPPARPLSIEAAVAAARNSGSAETVLSYLPLAAMRTGTVLGPSVPLSTACGSSDSIQSGGCMSAAAAARMSCSRAPDDCDSTAGKPAKPHQQQLLTEHAGALQQLIQQQRHPQQLVQQQQQPQQQQPQQQQQQQQQLPNRNDCSGGSGLDSTQSALRTGLERNLETVCEACLEAEEGIDSFRGSTQKQQQQQQQQQKQQQQQQQQQDCLQKLTVHALQRHHQQRHQPQQQQRQQQWTAEPGTLIYKSSAAKTCSEGFKSSSSPSSRALKALESTPGHSHSHNLNTASFDRWLEATSIRLGSSASKASSSSSSRKPRSPKHARSIPAASGSLSAVGSRTPAAAGAAAAAVRSGSPARGHMIAGSPTSRKAHPGFGSNYYDSSSSSPAEHEPCADLGVRVDSTRQLARQQNDYRKFLLQSLGSITD